MNVGDAVNVVDNVDGSSAPFFHEEYIAICWRAAAASRWDGKQPCDSPLSPIASKPRTPRDKIAPTYLPPEKTEANGASWVMRAPALGSGSGD
jgi:hypothetical protein